MINTSKREFLQVQKPVIQLENPFTHNPDGPVSLRIYPDNKPETMEIAALQKGLVMLSNGSEVIEEGAGFGVPIARYFDKTYFSKTATVYVKEQNGNTSTIVKVFSLDSVSKKRIHRSFVNDTVYLVARKTFERAYLSNEKMRPLFDWTMGVRKVLGVETDFKKVMSKGEVTVVYRCHPDCVEVEADFSKMENEGCQEILMLNEQGATFFCKHRDGDQAALGGRRISAWGRVESQHATFSDLDERVSFGLEKRKGAVLFRGREQVKDRFSWSGMTYSLHPSTAGFSYVIRLKGNST